MSNVKNMGRGMQVLAWVSLLLLLGLYFQDELEQQYNPNQDLANREILPASEVALTRNRQGHYIAPGWINGEPVAFLLDTGATDVSIPASLAKRIGLRKGQRGQAMTANGVVTIYYTELKSVELGGIEINRVRASINPGMREEVVLLGMSFMKQLELVQRGDTLTLRKVN